jgi:hypothetical protein
VIEQLNIASGAAILLIGALMVLAIAGVSLVKLAGAIHYSWIKRDYPSAALGVVLGVGLVLGLIWGATLLVLSVD